MSLAQFDLTGQKILCAGAGRGIGKGIALAFTEAGADVAVNRLDKAIGPSLAVATAFWQGDIGTLADIIFNMRKKNPDSLPTWTSGMFRPALRRGL